MFNLSLQKNLKRCAISTTTTSSSQPLCKRPRLTSSSALRFGVLSSLSPYAFDIHELDRKKEKLRKPLTHDNSDSSTTTSLVITAQVRTVLVDWLVEVVEEFMLSHYQLVIAVDLLDRLLSLGAHRFKINRDTFQLVGVVCLFIATKLDQSTPTITTLNGECTTTVMLDDFVSVTDGLYTRQQALAAEQLVLTALGFNCMATVTIAHFLPFYLSIGLGSLSEKNYDEFLSDSGEPHSEEQPELHERQQQEQVYHYASFVTEVLLTSHDMFVSYVPSHIAASIVVVTEQSFHLNLYTSTLELITGYTREQLTPCVDDVKNLLNRAQRRAAYDKYNQKKFGYVSSCYPQ